MTTLDELQAALNNNQILTVKYFGGSQPGAVRQIAPIEIKDDKLRAKCYFSNKIKLFKVEKIEILHDTIPSTDKIWDPKFKHTPVYNNLESVFKQNITLLENLGWYLNSSKNEISLHGRFKNGNPKKGSDVSITFEEYTYDLIYDDDLDDFIKDNHRKRTRPWVVMAKNMEAKTYKKLDHAVDLFIEKAKEMSPNN